MRNIKMEVREDRDTLKNVLETNDCEGTRKLLEKLKVKELIVYKNKCKFLKQCGLNEVNKTENYCHLINLSPMNE